MKTYGYCRVSTERQAKEGESLGVQERMISGYAMQKGLPDPTRIFVEDGITGKIPFPDRPQGRAVLDVLERGDVLIASKLERAFRSALDALGVLEDLTKRGVTLVFCDIGDVTNDAIGKLVFTILAAVAEGERDKIASRVRDVKQDQKRRGRYLGGSVPFGYRLEDQGGLVEIPEQQEALEVARKLRADNISLRKICARLEDMGHKVSHVTLGNILDAKLD